MDGFHNLDLDGLYITKTFVSSGTVKAHNESLSIWSRSAIMNKIDIENIYS